MKVMRVVLVLIVAGLLSPPVFGAGKEEVGGAGPGEAVTPAASKSEFGPMYPIPGNVTLKVWVAWSKVCPKYIQSYAQNEAFIRAMEDTGVKLEFTHPPIGQEQESFNLMVASGDLADIIVKNLYKGREVQGVKDGIFADITDLVPRYAPNYYAILNGNAEFRREATTSDGRIYQMAVYKEVPAKLEGEWFRPQLRPDWLKEFGMEVPKTFAQFEQYFQKVLENKPGVVPFVLPKTGQDYQLEQPYGFMPGFFLLDGKVTYDKLQSGYKDYLQMLNRWYKAGYISQDFISAKPYDLFYAQKAACIMGTSITVFQSCKKLGIPVVTAPYPRITEGQKLHAAYTLWPKNDDGNVFSAKTRHLKEAITFMDYGFHPEGYKTYVYGPKGIAWVPGPDGRPQYTDYMLNHPKYPIADIDYLVRIHTYWGGRVRDPDRYSIPMNIKDPTTLDYRLMWADDPDADAAYRMPPFLLTPEDNTKRANILNNVNTYADEMILKFIVGKEPFSNYEKFVETIRSMKIDDAIALTQKAYDAHMSKK